VEVSQYPYLTTGLSGTTDVMCPDLGVTISGPDILYTQYTQADSEDAKAVYEIMVTNHDRGHGDDASAVLRLEDIAGYEVLSASPEPLLETDTMRMWDLDTIAPGAAKTVQLTIRAKTFQPTGVDMLLRASAERLVDDVPECADGEKNAVVEHVDVVSLEMQVKEDSKWWPVADGGEPAGGTYEAGFSILARYRTSMPARPPIDRLRFAVEAPLTPATLANAQWVAYGSDDEKIERDDDGTGKLFWRLEAGQQIPPDKWFGIVAATRFTDAEVKPDSDLEVKLWLNAEMQGLPDNALVNSVETLETLPVASPVISTPRDGQACVWPLKVSGVAQRNAKVHVKVTWPGGEPLEETVDVDVAGEFVAVFDLTAAGVHTVTATTVVGEARGEHSALVELNVGYYAFDPQRTVWEGTLKDGPGKGRHRSYRFKDASGRLSAEDFRVPGEYGFWDTTLHLHGCGCKGDNFEPSFSVIADGIEYTQVGEDEQYRRVFNVGGAHQVEIIRTCESEQTGTQETTSAAGVLLIDPDGFIFDTYAGWGNVIPGATATCIWWNEADGAWVPWPAHIYEAQINPQTVDDSGYFAFFTPPGFYYIDVQGPEGFLHWRSPVVQVIDEIVHVNVPYTPDVEAAAAVLVNVGPAGLLNSDGELAELIALPRGSVVEWLSVAGAHGDPSVLAALLANPIVRVRSERDALVDVLGWDSGMLAPGARYRRAFETPGAFRYTTGVGHTGTIVIHDDEPPAMADSDGDGVPDAMEMGPAGDEPGYDGDANGTPDAEDAASASFPLPSGAYVTVHTSAGALGGAGGAPNPSPSFAPEGLSFPWGFVSWRVEGLAAGQAAVVTIELPADAAPEAFFRHGPGASGAPAAWQAFDWDEATQRGAEIEGGTVRVHVTDGAEGDNAAGEPGVITGLGAAGLLERAALGVQAVGGGRVTSAPDGIDCGAQCSASFALGAEVTLSASPEPGWIFDAWEGPAYECGSNTDCAVVLEESMDVVAIFVEGGQPPEDAGGADAGAADAGGADAGGADVGGEDTGIVDAGVADTVDTGAGKPDAPHRETAATVPDGSSGAADVSTGAGEDAGAAAKDEGGGCNCSTTSGSAKPPLSSMAFLLFVAIWRLRRRPRVQPARVPYRS
jgi:MYXO-CTERM domain-containing protein